MATEVPDNNTPREPPTPDGTPDNTSGFLSVTEAAAHAKVSDETIRAWYDSGELTGTRDHRDHRLIDHVSLTRRLDSMGVVEAARLVDRSAYLVRRWFDDGHIDGYRTVTGRRRIFRASVIKYNLQLAEREAMARKTP